MRKDRTTPCGGIMTPCHGQDIDYCGWLRELSGLHSEYFNDPVAIHMKSKDLITNDNTEIATFRDQRH